jgi:hypothetical protein
MQANAGSTADYDNSPQTTRGERIKIRRFRRFRFEVRQSQSDSGPISTDVIPCALPRDLFPNQNLCNLRNPWMITCSFVSRGRLSLPCLSYLFRLKRGDLSVVVWVYGTEEEVCSLAYLS